MTSPPSPPPPPASHLAGMARDLATAATALLAATLRFPRDGGVLVQAGLARAVRSVVESCLELVVTLGSSRGKTYPQNGHPLLQSFGMVQEKCQGVKGVARSSKEAGLVVLRGELGVLKDALGELEEARSQGFMEQLQEEDGMEEEWREEDKELINPCVGLIKTAVALVKKTTVTVKSEGQDEEEGGGYDLLCKSVARLSPCVDDLAMSLYPPVDWGEAKLCAQGLREGLEGGLALLGGLKFMQGEPQKAWADFIGKAVVHNFSEIQRVFVTRGLAEIRVSEEPGES